MQDAKSKREEERQKQLRWREENRSALLAPAGGAGGRESIDSVGGARPSSAGVSSLGQLLRQKYWQQDARVMQSADTQDSNVLGGAVMPVDRRDAGSAHTLTEADLPPSYTSKSATLPLDSRATADEMVLDDDDGGWQSPHLDHDEPVHSIEFAEDSEDEVPDFQDSPLEHSDMVASGSSHLAPVTETAIDDDYELIHVQPTRPHHDPSHLSDVPRSHSPVISSLYPSRHASPAPSDTSRHTPVESRPGSRGAIIRAHKPPPPPPPPRRIRVSEEDIPTLPFDPFESLPPPAEMMMEHEQLEEDLEEEPPVPHSDPLHPDDDPASAHPYWHAHGHGSKPTDL